MPRNNLAPQLRLVAAFLLVAPLSAANAAEPIAPRVVAVTPQAHAGGPAIALTLTGTLDLTTDSCGTAESFAVPPGTDIRFCYFAHNVGGVTFELHDLSDMNGTVFTDLPVTLEPGFAMYLMQNRQPNLPGANTATWTATDGAGGQAATDDDTATVTLIAPVVYCNGGTSTFSNGIPLGWTSFDYFAMAALPDSDVDWANLAGCGEALNYTGGRGDVACASSSLAGAQAYDTQLRTHSFSLAGATTARLEFRTNYQDAAAGGDTFAIDASLDGGASWLPVAASADTDYGVFRALPGAEIVVDLASFAGEPDVRLGFRYVHHASGAHDEYVQIDDVRLLCNDGLFFDGFESGDTHAWSEEVQG